MLKSCPAGARSRRSRIRLGAHVMARLTDAAGLRDQMVRSFNLPAETFSGDLLCSARAPGDVLNVLLADAPGMVWPQR
jgi:hypothetical protein